MSTSIRIAAFVLLLMAIAMGALAIGLLGYGIAFSGAQGISVGVAVGVLAAIHAIAAFGLWRARTWASWLALVVSVVGFGAAVLTAVSSLNSGLSIGDRYYGQLQPWVDVRGMVLAVAGGVGYTIVLWVVLGRVRWPRNNAGAGSE